MPAEKFAYPQPHVLYLTSSDHLAIPSKDRGFSESVQLAVVKNRGSLSAVAYPYFNVDTFNSQDYALVIVDAAHIPYDADAWKNLIESIRRQDTNVPIIVASASPQWQYAGIAFQAGITDYMTQVIDDMQIHSLLKPYLHGENIPIIL